MVYYWKANNNLQLSPQDRVTDTVVSKNPLPGHEVPLK